MAFEFSGTPYTESLTGELMAAVSEAANHIGRKQAAFELFGPNASQPEARLSHALSGTGGRVPDLRWHMYFATHAPNDRIARVVATAQRRELVPMTQLTPEEELKRLREVLREECGPTQLRAIEARVRGEVAK